MKIGDPLEKPLIIIKPKYEPVPEVIPMPEPEDPDFEPVEPERELQPA